MPKRLLAAFAIVLGITAPAAHAASSSEESAVERAQTGLASYYARHFEGRRTASGETFRHAVLMAAHPTLPFGTIALVTNLAKGYSVIVQIADRGPSPSTQRRGVIIDLSQSAAEQLKMLAAGRVPVSVEVLEWGAGQTYPASRLAR